LCADIVIFHYHGGFRRAHFTLNTPTDGTSPEPHADGRYLAAALQQQTISIRGARTHNLKNIDLDIPRNQLVVITGLQST
jgi:excinuclease ABC subunit A